MDKIFWRIVTNNRKCDVLNKYMIHSQYCFYLFHPNKQELFFPACKYGKLDVIKILLPYVDPTARDNLAIRWASYNGHLEVVKCLLTIEGSRRVDPTACDNFAIRLARQNGHLEVVKLLKEYGCKL